MALSISQVSLALVPILIAILIYGTMVKEWRTVILATLRMVIQLVAIGYALNFIFTLHQPIWVGCVVLIMSLGAGWIALRPIKKYKKSAFPVLVSVMVSGGLNLVWILAVVLRPDPWFLPSTVIPITGMVMASAMNAVSLCAERFWSERQNNRDIKDASLSAITAGMIPQINALFAVGLVSLPGMMTGQILSGVSPLIAVRYQIVIMSMVLSTAALGSFLYLRWQQYVDKKN